MFLSFLVPLPGTLDGLLVIHYGGTFGESHIMSFPDERPAFKDDNEVMIGFSTPVGKTGWAFNLVGAGELKAEDRSDDPALSFFYNTLTALDRGTDEEKTAALEIIESYVGQTKEYFFDDLDDELISASELSTEAAALVIGKHRATMH